MDLSFISLLRRLFTQRDKKIIIILLLASIVVSVFETLSISAIMVFISVATNFDIVQKNVYCNKLYRLLGCSTPANFVIVLGLGLIAFYFFRAALNVCHIYYMSKFAHMRQHYFASRLFQRYLHFSYRDLVSKNSSTLSQAIFAYSSNATQIISALLMICSEFFTVACIYAMLFYVNWKMTCVLTFLLSLKLLIIVKTFSRKITEAGKRNQKFSLEASRTFTESFWNFKFLKLIGYDKPVRDRFEAASLGLAQANTVNAVWQGLPRFILETIGFFLLISIILYVVLMYNNASFVLPMVSMYALAFYRFLPSINKMVTGYNQIIFSKHALKPIYEFLQHDFESLGTAPMSFHKTITFQHVSFGYSTSTDVLNNVELTIAKGQRVGFIGESGAGKSTIADVLMGLFRPTEGRIMIDNQLLTQDNLKAWRQKIGYIPQSIYLFDGTVADNIVCGRAYDESRLVESLKKSHVYDFLSSKDGIATKIGEGGINVSGGQKQRIAIARALYSDPDILVLDEATSALDHETESKIMDEIYMIDNSKTLIIIAHRLTTIERCDTVYRLEKGTVSKVYLARGPSRQHVSVAINSQ